MSRRHGLAVVGLVGALVLQASGCALPVIEGAKGAHVATEGQYEPIAVVAPGALAKYTGYKVGACAWKPVSVPADTKEADKAEVQKQVDSELKTAKDVVAVLPDRYNEYMVDDAAMKLNAAPCLLITVRDVRVTKRHGAIATVMPRVAVEGVVTLADAQSGQVLGTAKVFGHTSSLILGTPRQLANFICRGTAKWVNESRAAGAQ